MNVVGALATAALVAGAAAIVTHYRQRPGLHYFFKPAATVLIIVMAMVLLPSLPPAYGYLIVTGLVFSLAGDVFLMLPRDRFLAGLVAFLLAHWCYIAAFAQRTPQPELLFLAPWLVAAVIVLLVLRPNKGFMRYAVAIYVASIMAMTWLAIENWRQVGYLLAAVGALLFMFSDFLIGLRRFRGSWPSERMLTLGSYFPAQILIAASISPP